MNVICQSEILQEIKSALIKILPHAAKQAMHSSTRLREDLGLDSMTSLTFLMALEEGIAGFHVNPVTFDVNDLESIQSVMRYVERTLAGGMQHASQNYIN